MKTLGREFSLAEYDNGGTLLVPYPDLADFTTMDAATSQQIRRIKELRLISAKHGGRIIVVGDGNEADIIAAIGDFDE
jgi:hypothetical protein